MRTALERSRSVFQRARPESALMSIVTILLIVLIVLAIGGGGFLGGGAYRGPGLGLGGILIIILIVLLATGRL